MDDWLSPGSTVNYHRLYGDMVTATVLGRSYSGKRVQIRVHAVGTNCEYRCSVLPTSVSQHHSAEASHAND
jgi:hypothetical protein